MAWFGGEANAFIAGAYQHMKGRDKYLTVTRRVLEVRRLDGEPIEMYGTSGNFIPTLRSNEYGYLPTFEVRDLPEDTEFIQVKTDDGQWRRLYRNDRLIDLTGVLPQVQDAAFAADASAAAAAASAASIDRGAVDGVAALDSNQEPLTGPTQVPLSDIYPVKPANGQPVVGQRELILNAKDYGALGDGATNDAAAINAAITAAAAAANLAPAVVWLPYTATGYAAGAISLGSNVTLRGENRVLLKRTGTSTGIFVVAAAKTNVVIENLTLDPNGLASIATIRASTGTSGMRVRNCKFIGGITKRVLTTRSLASNVVTLTTAAPHGLTAGASIRVTGVVGTTGADGALNGVFTIATVPTTTTLTYSLTHANLASAASTGSVLTDITPAGVHGFDTQASTSDLIVEDCEFDGHANNIRIAGGPARVTIQRNRFTNWQERCIYVLGNATQAVKDLNIERNVSRDMVGGGAIRQPFTVQGEDTAFHEDLQFNFNRVYGPGTAYNDPVTPGTADQLSLHRVHGFVAIGNISHDGGDVGFTIARQCSEGLIIGNVITGANSAGMAIGSLASTYTRGLTISGNVCTANGRDAISDRNDTKQGIWMRKASDIVTGQNVLGDYQGVKTQNHGYKLQDCTNVVCGIDVNAGNATGMYDVSGGGNVSCTKPATPVAL